MRLILALLLLLSFSSVALADCESQTDIPAAECNVLESIYQMAGGANWTDNSNWLNDSPCTWYGILCGDGSVTRLQLSDNGLTGTVPELSVLSSLFFINLDFNQLTGNMPDLSGLTELDGADFYDNQFSGEIPPLSNLPRLRYLNLGNNNLSGTIPESLSSLPSLSTLVVEFNQMSGTISSAFSSSAIENLAFDWDQFCVLDQTTLNWLSQINVPTEEVPNCWSISIESFNEILGSGDVLQVFARISTPILTESVPMDLYFSLLAPDGQTEAYIVLTENGIGVEIGSAGEGNWLPTLTDFTLTPNFDSGLTPILTIPLSGNEGSGTYRLRSRATVPGTTEILLESEDSFYLYPTPFSMEVAGPSEIEVGETVVLELASSTDLPGVSYQWDFDDGSVDTGKSIEHSFSEPDRYRIQITAEIAGSEVSQTIYHYVNVARPFEQTIYPLLGTQFNSQETVAREFSWNSCDSSWEVYNGKYFKLWFESSEDPNVDREVISNGLLFADYLFEEYSAIFGWDYIPTVPALDIYICRTIPGGGTGTGGTFLNNAGFVNRVGDTLSAQDYTDYIHEFVHAWDFRGGSWLNSEDAAHAFTGGMEPVIQHLLGTGQGLSSWGGDLSLLPAFAPDFLLNHYMRVMFGRYLSRQELSWESYYGTEFQSLSYETEPIPEHKEALLVQGGLLTAIYTMHGLEGLQSIFAEVERNILENPATFDNLGDGFNAEQQRADNFMRVVADGLQLDVSDYFSYWKWPIAGLDAYMSRYPVSDKILDADGDGYSPLQGDLNDSDASVYPYAAELVDGKDNNLDGLIDENVYHDGSPDVDTQAIQLPATIIGTIDSLQDQDSFEFTVPQDTVVSIVMYSVDSDTSVPYSAENSRTVSTFAGTVYLNGTYYSELLHEAMSAPEAQSAIMVAAGTNTITVSPINLDGRNGNPGRYEIQIFENDYEHALPVNDVLNQLYPDQ